MIANQRGLVVYAEHSFEGEDVTRPHLWGPAHAYPVLQLFSCLPLTSSPKLRLGHPVAAENRWKSCLSLYTHPSYQVLSVSFHSLQIWKSEIRKDDTVYSRKSHPKGLLKTPLCFRKPCFSSTSICLMESNCFYSHVTSEKIELVKS